MELPQENGRINCREMASGVTHHHLFLTLPNFPTVVTQFFYS